MSSGRTDSTARESQLGRAAQVYWARPANCSGEEAAANAAGFSHWQVELPSRRWYIEAAGDGRLAE